MDQGYLFDDADAVDDPSADELYEWALAECVAAGTRLDAVEVLAAGLGLGERFREIRP